MSKLKIEYLNTDDLIPYEGNAKKHPQSQIDQIVESIKENGFLDPVAIWQNNEIIEGHGRVIAAKQMGIKKLPVIRLDDLTDEQRRSYILVHNQLTMNSGFDPKILEVELAKLPELNMEKYGFKMPDVPDLDDGWYGDERERTNKAYNLDIAQGTEMTEDFWQMPVIRKTDHIPESLIGFNYAKSSNDKSAGIHFYIDDYQFERVWSYPDKYTDVLKDYDCILSPDFSLYMDMPMPMKIWNVYRSRQIGAFYQQQGLTVIPTLSWAEPETFVFAFQGIEKGAVVSVSTVGVKESKDAVQIWTEGMDEAIKQIEPSAIIEYGGDIGYDYGNIPVYRYKNQVTENWHER